MHGGRSREGVDCWGLAILIYRNLGFELIDTNAYQASSTWTESPSFVESYHKGWKKIINPGAYDIVFFKNKKGIPVHIGIMLDGNVFIQAVKKAGVVLSRVSDKPYKDRVEGYYHLKARDENQS